jgi:hypothetical protein
MAVVERLTQAGDGAVRRCGLFDGYAVAADAQRLRETELELGDLVRLCNWGTTLIAEHRVATE